MLAALTAGRPVIVTDELSSSGQATIVLAAQLATPDTISFMVRHTSGFLCVPMLPVQCDLLGLPAMYTDDRGDGGPVYMVTADARDGITTGISAHDRARTINLLADENTTAHQLTRPGHVVPQRARQGGVLARHGATEAAVDLCRLAGLRPVGVIAELVNDDGTLALPAAYKQFCVDHGLERLSIADLIGYRQRFEPQVERISSIPISTPAGTFVATTYRSLIDSTEHLALVHGDIGDGESMVVRLHRECLVGDLFGSSHCDCGELLRDSVATIQRTGRGVILYLRGQDGHGVGLDHGDSDPHRIASKDHTAERMTISADPGSRPDWVGTQMLADLGIRSVFYLQPSPRNRAISMTSACGP